MAEPELVSDPTPSDPAVTSPEDEVLRSIPAREPQRNPAVQSAGETGEGAYPNVSNRALVIALVILLTLTAVTLISQMRATTALQEQVTQLESEVVQAQATAASY